jgi:hypothetical protein
MKKKLRGFPTYFFLFLSLFILVLMGYGIFRLGYQGLDKLFPSLQGKVMQQREYITSYLTHTTRLKIIQDALIILEDEKKNLAETQYELDELEVRMESFISAMEEKQEVYEANVSSFDIGELIKDARAAAYLEKFNTLFSSEVNRRKRLFLEGYESERKRLLYEKNMHEKRISELSQYIEEVQRRGPEAQLYTDGLSFMEEAKKLGIESAVFFIKREEYRRAADELRSVADTGIDDQGLLVRLLQTLDDLEKKRIKLTREDPLTDLKLSYLSEDYEVALKQVEKLNTDPYIMPLLSGLSSALYRNIAIESDINEDIDLKKGVKNLMGMASRLEKNGEYKKAVKLYKKLLLLDLPPHDVEYLTEKLYSAMEVSIVSELKRRDNTKAIKLLEDARRLVWEGKKDEALRQYLLLIKECPNSDYIGQAVGEIIGLRG